MDESDISSIGKQAATGVVVLISRTALLQVIAFGATFLLTIILSPEIFGVFFLVSAAVSFLNYFSDIGLAAALIQKKEKLTENDLKTTFTIQQILVVTISILALLFSGYVKRFYNLGEDGIVLFQSLVLSFFLSSLKTIPSVLLERKLAFNKLVIPQVVETVAFYIVALFLAFYGFGINSFSVAVLTRGIVGLILMYIVSPWKVGFNLDRAVSKRLLSYGIPFHLNSLLALVKDDLFTLYIGKVLSFRAVGYIGWAKKWAETPLRLIMDNIVKVTFPTYSRLQHNTQALKHAIETVLFYLSLLTFPMTIALLFLIKPLMELVPRYGKWEPALLSFYLFTISGALSTITSPLINVLNSIGKVKITLGFMMLWTILTWTVIPMLIPYFGFHAMAIGILIISCTVFMVMLVVKRIIDFSVRQSVVRAALLSLPLFLYLYLVSIIPALSPVVRVGLYSTGGLGIWAITLLVSAKKDIVFLINKLKHEI